ncbi:Caffeine synthase 1 [Triticum urartu]|uniref:Caffeine synthase 1 n=2 Tax=Triticum urartu TaxID=4572 RepID=M8A0P1_TRIUA|nr:Caffeine synthase 1 [Triticum urartu]
MDKTIPELFTMLKAAEVEIKKEHQVLMVNKTSSFKKKGKGKKGNFKKNGKQVAAQVKKPKSGPKPETECFYYRWTGHIGVKRMKKLHADGVLESLDYESLDACEPCLMGKMTKTPFSGTMERATDLLKIIHIDVCGPMSVDARDGLPKNVAAQSSASTPCAVAGGSRSLEVGPAARKAMASKQTAPIMNQGQGETSYAHNSSIQNAEQNKMKSLIEAVVVELCSNTGTLQPGKMVIVDLGCSTGPNALALVSIAVEAIHAHCLQFQQPSPEVSVLLNDLPENDFNTVVKSLVTLRQSNDPVVVTGITPGSFYERLFTSESVHLVCSSNSLHWLSKAPEDLKTNLIPAYDIDEHSRHERLPIVLEAYAKQRFHTFSEAESQRVGLRRPNDYFAAREAF